ncbi:tRNA epoxyqueuosine(34) reductase QueG [Hahella sp. CCB-MM4]|uniref:tRNA epoxyqueuosine(34) reductase QueG n=1 Tax=Hahella sp. (strain CCB-MM4) TaxID=1926491 RepID=UPI000B9A2DE2|nr:tRNA epoxyqueuosine(34) reductase QueG [Hahella sp. CCB-MM4]OZG71528.1 tRNA epoxyqueuosine(34) reductase QueG [Hahella sp. CCB-MM4]
MSYTDFTSLAKSIKSWALELGFQQCGITDVDLGDHADHFQQWLANDHHGTMDYMASHGSKRYKPDELVPGTIRVISVRMDYWPQKDNAANAEKTLAEDSKAYVSRYTLGRDYHKLIRKRLAHLAERVQKKIESTQYRVFVDSAPVLERALAQKAGLGWIGKNTMLINPKAGSYFFLGEIFTDLPLPVDDPFDSHHCGSCSACMDFCPTNAFVGPQELDARRCISYLTIELKGSIPTELRPLMGNRIFGCDDCQMVCPWNKFNHPTVEEDFTPRHQLDSSELLKLFNWTEEEFLTNTQGSAIRRTGYESWLRNIAVALGNATPSREILTALEEKANHPSAIVREHVAWALERLNRVPS